MKLWMDCKLEICVDSVESAIIAQSAGADRVELCDNLTEGGTTPGYGSISSARHNLDIDLHVLIRPRGGDFLYSGLELDIMRMDIDICGECGVNGIVTGVLRSDGTVDIERTARLVELAWPMAVTFHRAFDMCADPLQSLEDVIATGAKRLLTSGQATRAKDGIKLINRLVSQAGERIIIMPGGGIDDTNILSIVFETNVKEVHLTGRKSVSSEMQFRRDNIKMGSNPELTEYTRKIADIDKIREILNILMQN
jgi:copper homeostasis protein